MDIIALESLTKSYTNKIAVSELSLQVRHGEIYGFIGPNGAGKSTTIRMIMQLVAPTSGRITLFGKDAGHPSSELRKRIGYLPSEIRLYESWSGLESLDFTARSYGLKLSETTYREQAELLDLDLGKKVKSYSLGNRKKLGLIQSLLHQPELLILDEPTSGLDPLIQRKLTEILRDQQKQGMTIFFSTHVLSEVEQLCDRVAMIREGKLLRVEDIDMSAKARRHMFRVRFAEEGSWIDELGLREFDPGVKFQNGTYLFEIEGELESVLKRLAGSSSAIVDLKVEHPSIEKQFMRDYEKEDENE